MASKVSRNFFINEVSYLSNDKTLCLIKMAFYAYVRYIMVVVYYWALCVSLLIIWTGTDSRTILIIKTIPRTMHDQNENTKTKFEKSQKNKDKKSH